MLVTAVCALFVVLLFLFISCYVCYDRACFYIKQIVLFKALCFLMCYDAMLFVGRACFFVYDKDGKYSVGHYPCSQNQVYTQIAPIKNMIIR